MLRENTLIILSAAIGSCSEASSSALETFIGKDVPTSTRCEMRLTRFAAGLRAISEPQLWPMSAAFLTAAESSMARQTSVEPTKCRRRQVRLLCSVR